VAMGVSAFGALFQRCVETAFKQSSAGQQLGGQAHDIAYSIAVGDDLTGSVPAAQLDSVIAAGRIAFVDSLTEVVGFCAVFAAIGAALAFCLIRRRDLHQSALDTGAPQANVPSVSPAGHQHDVHAPATSAPAAGNVVVLGHRHHHGDHLQQRS
jgi:hypothetical protein